MAAQRILLANEAGTGRGHVTTLKVFAEALGPGFVYDAALCRMQHADDLAPLCDLVFPGASLYYQPRLMALRAGRPIGNWAEFLACLGLADEQFLARQIEWWIATIKSRCSDLVVAEFATCAMLAARALGVPVISIGQGHSTPPAAMPHFPLPATGKAGLVHDEAELVATINRAGEPFGLPPLQYFSDIYRCDAQLPRTIAALDPYAAMRHTPSYLPPMGLDCPPPTGGAGDEVFVYLSGLDCNDSVLVDALASLDLPLRLVTPMIEPDVAARLEAKGARIELSPLPHAIIAQRSRVMVHAGQHGATCLGLALGLPQVALPNQSEQSANARRVAAMGVLSSFSLPRQDASAIAAVIHTAYADAAIASRAIELAGTLRPVLVGDTRALLRNVVENLLGRRVAA